MLAEVEAQLRHLGNLAGGRLHEMQLAERLVEPTLTQWDAWGNRVDRIELSPLWKEAAELAARHGLVATAYERRHGEWSRVHQFALVYVLEPSLDVYSCPLAMTDGAARTLLDLGNQALADRAVPRLTSRDPGSMWTSGQWMTERTGGSDVAVTETVARRTPEGLAPRRRRSGSPRRPPRRWRSPWPGPRATAPAAGASRSSTSSCATRPADRTAWRSTGSRTSSARARCRPPS